MKHWLMKAEPDSRIEKGKDVKFSVDDFEKIGVTPWEGVRNHSAKLNMKNMKVGDYVLFYHSNCKTPGVAAIAEVEKEAYPDYTAWDSEHPYYDPKSDEAKPTWFMVDLKFRARLAHFVPLALLRYITTTEETQLSDGLAYLTREDLVAIKQMPLLSQSRLSVQPVDAQAFAAMEKLGEKGGWEDLFINKASSTKKSVPTASQGAAAKRGRSKRKAKESEAEGSPSDDDQVSEELADNQTQQKRQKIVHKEPAAPSGTRRSTRSKKGD